MDSEPRRADSVRRTQPTRSGRAASREALPRLIALDLDGTFLSPDATVSAVNLDAVRRLSEVGTHVVFATGRPVRCLDVLRDVATDLTFTIAANGAVLYDHVQRLVLASHPLDRQALHRIVTICRRRLPSARFAVEFDDRLGYEPGFVTWPATDDDPTAIRGDLAELLNLGEVLKVLVQCDEHSTHDAYLRLCAWIGDAASISHSATGDRGPVEISAPGVSKASTLRTYCRTRGIPRESVWAFGDMPNDLALLQWSGKAHVMANAHPSLDRHGFIRIDSNLNSGVGRTLLSWLATTDLRKG